MKTILAVAAFIAVLVLSSQAIQSVTQKHAFNHCLILYQDSLGTDLQIVETVRKCELSSGYTYNPELLP